MKTVKEIVQTLQIQFQGHAHRYSDDLMYHGNTLTKYESEKTVRELVALLAARVNDEQEANQTSLAFLIQFLENRWANIQATQSMYNHSPLTMANRLCLDVAKQLAEVTQLSKYVYLYPAIKDKLLTYQSENGGIDNLEPWEFVFDNEWNPIDVLLALKYVIASANGMAVHTNLTMNKAPIDIEASSRVFTSHAKCVLFGYNPENRISNAVVIPDKLTAEEVSDFDRDSYGEEGLLRQSKMMDLESLEKFAEMLTREYHKLRENYQATAKSSLNALWNECWSALVTPEILKNIISPKLNNQFFEKLESPLTYRLGDTIYNRAILFCFTAYYIYDRSQLPQYSGSVSQTISGYMSLKATELFASSKEKKTMAANHFLNFLTSDFPLDMLIAYMTQNRLEKHLPAMQQGMLKTENLPRIAQQATLVASPNFFASANEQKALAQQTAIEPAANLSLLNAQAFFQPAPPQPQPQPAPAKSLISSLFGW